MKPSEVRFHHIRDTDYRQKWCEKCKRMVPYFHEHHGHADFVAMPEVNPLKED